MSELKEMITAAYTAYEQGLYDRANTLFASLVTQAPSQGGLWQGLASARQAQGLYEEALEAWAMSALLQPTDPLPHFHAAICYIALSNKEEALEALDAALQKPCTEDILNKIHALKEAISHA